MPFVEASSQRTVICDDVTIFLRCRRRHRRRRRRLLLADSDSDGIGTTQFKRSANKTITRSEFDLFPRLVNEPNMVDFPQPTPNPGFLLF